MSAPLKPLELTWRGVNRIRRGLYESGRIVQRRLPRPVISIGNIAAGGTGKTPTVIAIAELLRAHQMKPAILTRGYGRQSDAEGPIVRGRNTACFGDEPVLMAMRLPDIDVVVGSDRFATGTEYLRNHSCDLFLLDDGFQHLQLHRDLDIVLDDPASTLLREGRSALRAADLILDRGLERSAHDGSFPPRFHARLVPQRWTSFRGKRELGELRGSRAVAFSALANNERFFALARQLGVVLVETHPFRDHHAYTDEEIEGLRRRAASLHADLMITTEKDLVKLRDDEDILALAVEMQITPRAAFQSMLLDEVRALLEK